MARKFDPEIGKATRWQKGQPSPNPGGRPRKTLLTSAYASVLGTPYPGDRQGRTFAEVIAWRVAMAAAKGKLDAAREIADRTEGKTRKLESPQFGNCLQEVSQESSIEELIELTEQLRRRAHARMQSRSQDDAGSSSTTATV